MKQRLAYYLIMSGMKRSFTILLNFCRVFHKKARFTLRLPLAWYEGWRLREAIYIYIKKNCVKDLYHQRKLRTGYTSRTVQHFGCYALAQGVARFCALCARPQQNLLSQCLNGKKKKKQSTDKISNCVLSFKRIEDTKLLLEETTDIM